MLETARGRASSPRHGRTTLGLLVGGVLAACAPATAPLPPVPPPLDPPAGPESPDDRLIEAGRGLVWEVAPPDFTPPGGWDEILHSPTVGHPSFQQRVAYWHAAWRRVEGGRLPLYVQRMAVYQDLVDEVLEQHGLPASLRYLPFLESGYSPVAVSRASAVGLWQFMAGTATEMRLTVSPLVDERRDPVKSTFAAARFLTQLRDRFGSWFLALAAYNGGPARVDRLLARHVPGAEPHDSLYLVIGPYLPAETREFVARFVAGAQIAMDPEAHGIEVSPDVRPFAWEEVVVEDAASMDVLAFAAGTTEDDLKALNPQLVRGMTVRGAGTTVRVPPGTAEEFHGRLAAIPPEERLTITEHRVASGETLTHIARAYGVRLAELQAANPGVDPRRLRIGQALVVPVAAGARAAATRSVASGAVPDVHVVMRGDTLWGIARRYAVGVEDLARWNALGQRRVIRPGQRLRLAPAG